MDFRESDYPTPAQTLSLIPDGFARSRVWPATQFIGDIAVYLTALSATALLQSAWLRLVAAIIAGPLLARLVALGHEAAHDVLTSSARLNRIIARCTLACALVPLETWRYAHNLHHAFLRVRDRDTLWRPPALDEWRGMSRWRRLFFRVKYTVPGIALDWWDAWLRFHVCPSPVGAALRSRRVRRDQAFVAGSLVLQLALLLALRFTTMHARPSLAGVAAIVFFSLIVPQYVSSLFISGVDLLTHTHPAVPWREPARTTRGDRYQAKLVPLRATVHVQLPPLLEWATHYVTVHSAHHVDPRLPLRSKARARRALEQSHPGDLLVEDFSLRYLRSILRRCRTFDYQRGVWTDFEGRPTSAADA
jgi:acyl-lipid omega-6 desaturase (Delta-12 desaturase)